MENKTYRYDPPSNMIVEVARMEEPTLPDEENYTNRDGVFDEDSFRSDMYHYEGNVEIYNRHISSLLRYPCSGFSPEDAGKELREGKEFVTRKQINVGTGINWRFCTDDEYNNESDEYRRIIAVRIPDKAAGEGKTHTLKTWPQYFQMVIDGKKKFEYRLNDRGFREGDELLLLEYDPIKKTYSGRQCVASVSFVLNSFKGIEDGYCIMSIDLKNEQPTPAPVPGEALYPASFTEWCAENAIYIGKGDWEYNVIDQALENYTTAELFNGPYQEWLKTK